MNVGIYIIINSSYGTKQKIENIIKTNIKNKI